MRGFPLYSLLQYLKYLERARGAYSLHSPFVYGFYNEVIRPSSKFRLKKIETLRKKLLKNHLLIDVFDFKKNEIQRKTISSIAKTSLSKPKFSAFLHMLTNHLHAESILETGTSLGINTLYLAETKAKTTVTIEGSSILAEQALTNFQQFDPENLKLVKGGIQKVFSTTLIQYDPDFIFLDADHRGVVTKKLIDEIMNQGSVPKCIVIHDIYWSKDMTRTWKALISDKRFNLTVDIFQAGLIFPKTDMLKQHFTLRF